MAKRKLEVHGLEEALAKVPEEDREALRKEVEKIFSDIEEGNLPGEPLEELVEGVKNCPSCLGDLVVGCLGINIGDRPVDILDCPECDRSFTVPASN